MVHRLHERCNRCSTYVYVLSVPLIHSGGNGVAIRQCQQPNLPISHNYRHLYVIVRRFLRLFSSRVEEIEVPVHFFFNIAMKPMGGSKFYGTG